MSAPIAEMRSQLELVAELAERYRLTALLAPLEACRGLAAGSDLTIAVFGRFKAGKSTLLNQVVGREVLPVGALPVTAVITALAYGAADRARVEYQDGRYEEIPLEAVARFITEAENPDNVRGAASVSIELRSLSEFRGIRLIDTPGLDSAFEHNTRATREWLPRVGIALVAIPSDSPLGVTDLALISDLRSYTPKVSVVLTKFDLLNAAEQEQVLAFVQGQLESRSLSGIEVFAYSARPGYEEKREQMHRDAMLRHAREQQARRAELLAYRSSSLQASCEDYLRIALKSSQARDAEREELRRQASRERESLQELGTTLRLIANHAAGSLRAQVGAALSPHAEPLRRQLAEELESGFPAWRSSLAATMAGFSGWLRSAMTRELARISFSHHAEFQAEVAQADRRLTQAVQDFESRVAERFARVVGMQIRPVEVAAGAREPQAPDVSIGRIFDHAWELLSWAVPMPLFGGMIEGHLARRLPWEVTKHLSRLTTQWEESLRAAILEAQQQAQSAAEEFVSTLERVSSPADGQSEALQRDLERLGAAFGKDHGG